MSDIKVGDLVETQHLYAINDHAWNGRMAIVLDIRNYGNPSKSYNQTRTEAVLYFIQTMHEETLYCHHLKKIAEL
jgi:hypothetical protein